FKVYGRALSEQEVVGACAAYTECKIPTNLSVTAGVEQNSLSWDAVSGATDYKIYWNTTGNVDSSSSSITVNGATTEDHISLTGGTTYYYRVSSVVGGVESALSVQQSATPLGSTKPTLTAVDNETQQVTINWNPVAGVDNYTIYWDTVSFTDNNSSNQILKVLGSSSGSVCSSGTCSYVHGGRDNGTTYYYRVAAVSAGGVAGARSNEASGTPRSFDGDPNCPRPTPNSDNDSALLVYYDFNVGLADQHRKYNDGRYDLSGADGFNLISAGSCFAGNRAGYFDSSGGYAFNDNFTSDNETALQDNFTISLWFNADQDMVDFSSLMSSRYVPDTGSDNDVWSFQIDSARRKKVSGTWTNGPWVRFRSAKGDASGDIDLYSQNQYNLHQWHHLAFVKYDNGTAILYLDNVSSSENFNTSKMSSNIPPWSTLKIGTNRREEFNWKGYIDEFKVYGRALDADDVSNLYTRDYP
ncbi:MAG: LamG-like jellyroll fold domain-containing protein, partial [bacterium]